MGKKITLLDGAQGTRLWQIADENGVPKEPVWKYNIEHPDFILKVVAEYAAAGSQVICANTFGVNRSSVERSSSYTVPQVVSAAVKTAKKALEGTDIKVALDIGPLSDFLEPYGDLTEEEAADIFDEMLKSGINAGADMVFFETFLDLEMMRVAAETAKKYGLPVICSMTFEKHGRTIMGNSVEQIIETLSPIGISAIGMNCSLGPDLALPVIQEFAKHTGLPLFFKPNAGLPVQTENGESFSNCTPDMFAADVAPALPILSYLGGCCGTNAEYIRKLKELISAYR